MFFENKERILLNSTLTNDKIILYLIFYRHLVFVGNHNLIHVHGIAISCCTRKNVFTLYGSSLTISMNWKLCEW